MAHDIQDSNGKTPRRIPHRTWRLAWPALATLVAVGGIVWASDWVTLKGRRVLYMAVCIDGIWQDNRCSGILKPAGQYVFDASKHRREVVHWVRGSDSPSITYTGCRVTSRDDWACPIDRAGRGGSGLEMRSGKLIGPLPGKSNDARPIAKWRWWLLLLRTALA